MAKKIFAADVLEVVRNFPGLTAREIAELMPDASFGNLQTVVSAMTRRGALVRIGRKRIDKSDGNFTWAATLGIPDGTPVPTARKMKLKGPTDAGLEARIAELHGQLRELEAWKSSAMERFPDLRVSPVVLKARKIVACEVKAGGDTLLAQYILQGLKDDTLMMRVTIKGLEEVA